MTANVSDSHSQLGAFNDPYDSKMMPPPETRQTSPNKNANARSDLALTDSRMSESGGFIALDSGKSNPMVSAAIQIQISKL